MSFCEIQSTVIGAVGYTDWRYRANLKALTIKEDENKESGISSFHSNPVTHWACVQQLLNSPNLVFFIYKAAVQNFSGD